MPDNKKPGFRRHLQVYLTDETALVLRDDSSTHVLKDPRFAELAPLLNGTRTEDDIVSELLDRYPAEELYYALLQLESKGLIFDTGHEVTDAETAFWHRAGLDLSDVAERRASRRLAIVDAAGTGRQPALESLLTQNSISISDVDRANLVLVLTDDYLKLDAVAGKRFEESTPWLPAGFDDRGAWIGPLLSSDRQIQWRYLKRRLDQNLHGAMLGGDGRGGRVLFRPGTPAIDSSRGVDTGFIATEATRSLLLDGRPLEDRLVILNAVDNRVEEHPVPDAATLADLQERFDTIARDPGIELQSRLKRSFEDGGFRTELPDATLSRIEPFVSAVSGIVPPIRQLGPETGVHVFVTGQPVAGASFTAVGKGISLTQARASCCAEALERYCAQFRGDEPREAMRYDEGREGLIHPGRLLNFSESQYDNRDEWNKSHQGFNWTPERFDDTVRVEWTPVWSLSRGERRWLPTAFCYHGYPFTSGPYFCRGDSNGCAAGNNREEAVLQGLFELIERDAAAIWWYNRVRRPQLRLETETNAYIAEVYDFHDRIGRSIAAIDITTDLGIPVVAALSWRREDGGDINIALGSHLDIGLAVSRALSELNQMSVYHWTSGSDQPNQFARHEHEQWKKEATIHNQSFLSPGGEIASLEHYGRSFGRDLRDDVQAVLDSLGEAGLETLALDITREDCPLSVVRMAVPGLRHFWARFAPGRLYQVPVTMGWRDRPLEETELNPIPVFI